MIKKAYYITSAGAYGTVTDGDLTINMADIAGDVLVVIDAPTEEDADAWIDAQMSDGYWEDDYHAWVEWSGIMTEHWNPYKF